MCSNNCLMGAGPLRISLHRITVDESGRCFCFGQLPKTVFVLHTNFIKFRHFVLTFFRRRSRFVIEKHRRAHPIKAGLILPSLATQRSTQQRILGVPVRFATGTLFLFLFLSQVSPRSLARNLSSSAVFSLASRLLPTQLFY